MGIGPLKKTTGFELFQEVMMLIVYLTLFWLQDLIKGYPKKDTFVLSSLVVYKDLI